MKIFSSGQILNNFFFVWSDFESRFLKRVKFWNKNFTTQHILNNLPKCTTCTFHVIFLHITKQLQLTLSSSIR